MITSLILLGLFSVSVVIGGTVLSGVALAHATVNATVDFNRGVFKPIFEDAETLVGFIHPQKDDLLTHFAWKFRALERTEDEVRAEFVKFLHAEKKHLG